MGCVNSSIIPAYSPSLSTFTFISFSGSSFFKSSYSGNLYDIAKPVPEGYPSTDQSTQYPDSIQQEFKYENFIPLTRILELINYQNAQIILIGAREGKDTIKKEIGIEIKEEPETSALANILSRLKVRKEEVPVRPITEGKLE
jgi:hypothetical protein